MICRQALLPALRILIAPGLTACLLFACSEPSPEPDGAAPAGAAASLRSGTLGLEEVEAYLRAQTAADDASPTAEEWPGRYRRATEALAVERILLEDADDFAATAREELGSEFLRLTCDVELELYLAENPLPERRIEEEEITGFYEEHRDTFERQEQRLAWHIFRRHENPEHPEETLALLGELRERILGGESFRRLAETYSQSENRMVGGHLGWMVRGKLPPDLETVVFTLELGAVSEPLSTSSGAFLVHVSDIIPGISISLDEAQAVIAQRLGEQIVLEQLRERAADLPLADGDLVLDLAEIRRRIQAQGAEVVVLRIGEMELRGGELLELAETEPVMGVELATPEERFDEAYHRRLYRQQLCRQARAEGFFETPERERALDRRLRRVGVGELVEHRLEDRILAKIDEDPEALRSFFDDHRHLFQSPLLMRVGGMAVGLGETPENLLPRVEAIRQELVAGALDLPSAIERLDAEPIPSRWLDPNGLLALEPKIRVYLTQVTGTGYTVPFQQNGLLQLLHVMERQEPALLPFEQALERVRDEFYRRRQQELFSEVKDELLEAAGYRYHPEAVAEHLANLGIGRPITGGLSLQP